MARIEAIITIDAKAGVNMGEVISHITSAIETASYKKSDVNVVEVDDPIATNPIHLKRRLGR